MPSPATRQSRRARRSSPPIAARADRRRPPPPPRARPSAARRARLRPRGRRVPSPGPPPRREDVPLHGEAVALEVARPIVDWRRYSWQQPRCVEDAELPRPRAASSASACSIAAAGSRPDVEQLEDARAVPGDARRLRRDGPDACTRPGHHGADAEVLRLHSDADLSRGGVDGDDRVRARASMHGVTLTTRLRPARARLPDG